jgi:hypothetical protein
MDNYDKLLEKFNEILPLVSKAIGNKKFIIIVDAINQFAEDRHRYVHFASSISFLGLACSTGYQSYYQLEFDLFSQLWNVIHCKS